MKIGELDQHCGNCKIIDYCAEPFDELCLCTDSRLNDVEEDKYIEIAEQSKKLTNMDICKDVIKQIQHLSQNN